MPGPGEGLVCAAEPADPAAVHALSPTTALARASAGSRGANDWPALMSVACGGVDVGGRPACAVARRGCGDRPRPRRGERTQGLFLRTRSVVDEAAPRCASASPSLVCARLARVSCERYGARLRRAWPPGGARTVVRRRRADRAGALHQREEHLPPRVGAFRGGADVTAGRGDRVGRGPPRGGGQRRVEVGGPQQAGDREARSRCWRGAWRDAATAGSLAVEASAALNHGEAVARPGAPPRPRELAAVDGAPSA